MEWVYDPNTGHLLRFWRELSLSPTTVEAFLIQTVQMRTHWPESMSQSIYLFKLKSNVEKVWPEWKCCLSSSRKWSISKMQYIYFRGEKDFCVRSLITVSKIKRIQHVEVFCQWTLFSLFHCALFGKTKFHLFPIMDISFWNKMFKGYCSQIDPYVI